MEEQALPVQTLARDRGERAPPRADRQPQEILPPEERDGVVEVARDGRGRPLERRARHPDGAHVVPAREVHQREVPDEMVAEPVEVLAGMDRGRQAAHALVERGHLVEGVGQRVDRPGVPGVPRDRGLRRPNRLPAAVRLLEGEGVEPENEGVLAVGRQDAGRHLEDLREAALPEPDEVEALEDDHVPRPRVEVLRHLSLGRGRSAPDQKGDGLDVTPLPRRLGRRRRARPLRRLPRRSESLLEEQADGRARVSQRQARVERGRLPEGVEGASAPAEEIAYSLVVPGERGGRGRRGREPVRVGAHDPSRAGTARAGIRVPPVRDPGRPDGRARRRRPGSASSGPSRRRS